MPTTGEWKAGFSLRSLRLCGECQALCLPCGKKNDTTATANTTRNFNIAIVSTSYLLFSNRLYSTDIYISIFVAKFKVN